MDELTDETLERLFVEVRGLVAAQRESLEMVDNRLSTLLRFDAILLGVLVTIGSLLWRGGAWAGMPMSSWILAISAILLLLGSVLSTVLAYRAGRLTIGLRAESIVTALQHRADERQVLRSMIRAYGQAVADNARVLERTRDGLNAALWALVLSLVCLSGSSMMLWMVTPHREVMTSKAREADPLPLDRFDLEYIPRHRDPSLRDRQIPDPDEDDQ